MRRHQVLTDLILKHQWKAGSEIGVNRGGLFFHLLDRCCDLKLIGVDCWCGYDDVYGDQKEICESVKLKAKEYPGRARILHGYSVDMACHIKEESLDFVFIDADHSTEAVIADIKSWGPKVRNSGFILGHDINWPSVSEAVSDMYCDYTILPGNVWMTSKNMEKSSDNS